MRINPICVALSTGISFLSLYLYSVPEIRIIPEKRQFPNSVSATNNSICINLGTFLSKEKKSIKFIIKNTGDSPLKIINIRRTCSCIPYELNKKLIPPFSKGRLTIYILPYSFIGTFKKFLYIQSNDPKRIVFGISIEGKSLPAFFVRPGKKIFAGRLQKFEQKTLYFDLIPLYKNYKLGQPEVHSNYPVTLKTEIVRPNPNGIIKHINFKKYIRLTVKFLPERVCGDLRCILKIPVLKPEGWAPLRIEITGKVGPSLYINPKRFIFKSIPSSNIIRKIRFSLVGKKTSDYFDPGKLVIQFKGLKVSPYLQRDNSIYAKLIIEPSVIKKLQFNSPLHIPVKYKEIKNYFILLYKEDLNP